MRISILKNRIKKESYLGDTKEKCNCSGGDSMSETTVAHRETAVREALVAYLLSVQTFYNELYSPEAVTKLEALIPPNEVIESEEPHFVQLARAEKNWLKQLFTSLSAIDQMLTNIEKWRIWFFELIDNLEFTHNNIHLLTQGPDIILEDLHKHKIDEGYVRLIVNNATNDFLENVKETRTLLDQLVEMEAFIQQLESPTLQIAESRLKRIREVNYRELLGQMQQLIAATYNAPTHEDFLRNLAALLHIFSGWGRMIQVNGKSLSDLDAFDKFVKEARKTVNEMNELMQQFHEFVNARNLADYYIRQAELSTIRMMLSYEGTAEKWWQEYIIADPEVIPSYIPAEIDANQLLIGVTHSLALLEDLDQRLLPQMPSLKTTMGKLGNFLQSPAVELYQEINEGRLAKWEEYERQMVSCLVKLRTALHELIKQQNRETSV